MESTPENGRIQLIEEVGHARTVTDFGSVFPLQFYL